MEQIGKILKDSRERQGLSINEVSTATKISARILKSIEESDFNSMPPKTYIRGFVQTYARYLKLDAHEIMELYRKEVGAVAPPKSTSIIGADNKKPHWSEKLPFMQGYSLTSKTIVVSLIMVLIVIIISVKKIIDKYEREGDAPSPDTVATLPITDTTLETAKEDDKDPESTYSEDTSVNTDLLKEIELEAQKKLEEEKQSAESEQKKKAESVAAAELAAKEEKLRAKEERKAEKARLKAEEENKKLEQEKKSAEEKQKLEEEKKQLEAKKQEELKRQEEQEQAQEEAQRRKKDEAEKAAATLKLQAEQAAKKQEEQATVPTATANTENAAGSAGDQEVIIEALDKVTLRLRVDDKKSETINLKPEQIYQIRAGQSIALSISDGGSVNVIHNGRDKGVPGELGRPISLKFPK